jgi:ADP-ribosylglycohydrolase
VGRDPRRARRRRRDGHGSCVRSARRDHRRHADDDVHHRGFDPRRGAPPPQGHHHGHRRRLARVPAMARHAGGGAGRQLAGREARRLAHRGRRAARAPCPGQHLRVGVDLGADGRARPADQRLQGVRRRDARRPDRPRGGARGRVRARHRRGRHHPRTPGRLPAGGRARGDDRVDRRARRQHHRRGHRRHRAPAAAARPRGSGPSARRIGIAGPLDASTLELLGGGWVGDEALAIAVACAVGADDFRHGVLAAANHSGDSDSTAAICGNLLGALWGVDAIPREWLAELELREEIDTLAHDLHHQFHAADKAVQSASWFMRYPGW